MSQSFFIPVVARVRSFLRRPVRFVDSWWLPVGLGGAVGALLVFSIVFLEPMGTDRYSKPFATLRYCGYGFCMLASFLIVHGLTRMWVERGVRVWRLGHELIALVLLLLLIFNSCYLYLCLVINEIPVTLAGWWGFSTQVAMPYVLLLFAPALLARRALVAALGDRVGEERIVLTGRNQDDRLRLAPSDFLFAEAEQNYVTLHFQQKNQAQQRMFRATLAEIESQLPGALRVHRSFLVNPARVVAVEGNARKRLARLSGGEWTVPVSPKFELERLEAAKSGAGSG
jgi:hypothetical protein